MLGRLFEGTRMLWKLLLAIVVAAALVLPSSGCFTHDMAHNRKHVQVWLDDMHYIHEDLDWIFGLRRRSYLHPITD